MAVLTQAPPTPEEARRQALLASLVGQAAPQPAPLTSPPATPTPASAAASPFPQPPDTTGTSDPSTQPVPAKPMYQPTTAPAAPGTVPTKDQWLAANPMAPGTAPPTFTPETTRHALLRSLFSGMQEFGRPGQGFAANQAWNTEQQAKEEASRNWPLQRQANIDTGYQKALGEEKTVAETQAAELSARPDLKKMIDQAAANGDQERLNYLLDVMQRENGAQGVRYVVKKIIDPTSPGGYRTADFDAKSGKFYDPNTLGVIPNAQEFIPPPQGAQLPVEVGGQVGPKPTTNVYGKPGTPPKTYATTEEAIAAWAKDAQDVKGAPAIAAAQARGAAYNANRIYKGFLDTKQGNAPVSVSGGELLADQKRSEETGDPRRYIDGPEGVKALTKESVIEDIRGSGDQVHGDLQEMQKAGESFDPATLTTLAASLADPEGTVGKFLQVIPREKLTHAQRMYVIDVFQYREQAMNLRAVAGGSSAEDVRRAILLTLPGISPDTDWAESQINAVNAVLDRVERGIPTVKLKPEAHPSARGFQVPPDAPAAPKEDGHILKVDGKEYAVSKGGTWQQLPTPTR